MRIEDKHGDYRTLTAQCVRLCQMWRNAVMDTVVFSQCDGDPAWNELRRSDAGDEVSLHPAEDCALSEQEKDAALRCISAMLSAETLEDSLRSILHVLGTQYQADRVYVLALDENRHMVLMPYEWTSPCKPSIQTVVSGLPVERFPMLQRCIAEQKPIHLTRPRPLAEDGDGPWRFSIFPIWDDKRMTGFLCLENPRLSPADTALAATLAPHILGEQRRFQSRTQLSSDIPGALLRGMPNLRSYMNVIYSLNSDIYSTLGAVCLDVPGLSEINGRLGFEYGSKLLCFISKTLSDLFGGTFLFRIWDAEFVALCPDTTQQVFDGRCLRLRAALQRRYPKDIRVGTAWSDGIFTGKELVQEAREMMRCQRVDAVLDANGAAYQARQAEAVSPLQQFTVYFQPLVHMGTGALAGAEVLVRGLDASGQLIPPDRFIHSLEERGEIRDLDLFVLEQAFAQLNRWQEKGLEPCPIAVNMSRMTLFDTSTFASVLAICSRYPKLPLHLLELEITESAGSVGSHALTEIVDRFRQVGVRVALDDFGSQYANFSIFTHVKFDCVKLDRTLISDLTVNRRTQMLVRDLVEICHSTDMLCVAEGVETQAQREALLKAGCNYGQGYYFSRPVSAERFETQFLHAIPAESGGATSKEATK